MFSACVFHVSGMHATRAPLHVSHLPLSCAFHVPPLHVVRVPSHMCRVTITPLFCILLVPSRSWSVRPIPVWTAGWGARVPCMPPCVLPAHTSCMSTLLADAHATVTRGLTWYLPDASRRVCWECGSQPGGSCRGVPAAGFLPRGSCLGAPPRCSRATLGLCFLSVHPDRHSRLQTLGTSCPLPPPLTF